MVLVVYINFRTNETSFGLTKNFEIKDLQNYNNKFLNDDIDDDATIFINSVMNNITTTDIKSVRFEEVDFVFITGIK